MTTVLASQPENKNYLSPLGFRFIVKKLPNVNYFCQSVSLPGVTLAQSEMPTPFVTIPFPGSKLTYDPLNIKFKVDANLANYKEVYNWLTGLGHPTSFDQTKTLSLQSPVPALREGAAASFISDGALVVLNAMKNATHLVSFRGLFPISLSELTFDSTDADVIYLDATVTFRYMAFDFQTL